VKRVPKLIGLAVHGNFFRVMGAALGVWTISILSTFELKHGRKYK